MRLIKQRNGRDCGLCVAAMLTDRSYEAVLADNCNYQDQTDQEWIDYIRSLGFLVRRTKLIRPGHRYFCVIGLETEDDPRSSHAIALDEQRRVFDPSSRAPDPGVLPVEWYASKPRRLGYVHRVEPKV